MRDDAVDDDGGAGDDRDDGILTIRVIMTAKKELHGRWNMP